MSLKTCLRALIVLSVVLTLACGSAPVPVAAPSTVVVSEADAGKTLGARVGDTVRVKLQENFPVPGSSLVWDVSTNAPSILAPGKVTRDPAVRPRAGQVNYTADFTVAATGQARLIARGSATCEAMANCPQHDFTVTVVAS